MKPLLIIPPVVALVIAAGWVGSQRQTISALEQETLVLRKRLDAGLSGSDAGSTPGKSAPPAKATKDDAPIDWKKLAGELKGTNRGGGPGDMKAMMKLQKRLMSMNREELASAGILIATLISSDAKEAGARLAALPADQRSEVLGNYSGGELKDEDQAAFADLVRSQLPEKEQAKTLAQTASLLAWGGGYETVTAYMDRINATATERAAVAEQTAETRIEMLSQNQKITRETIDSLREWTTAQAPAATGKALANATRGNHKMAYAEAADLAVQYHATSGNDDVLVKFLDGSDLRKNKEKAGELAALISDEKRRNRILTQVTPGR